MQKIILFIEPEEHAFHTSAKMGNMLMNRFAIDEEASNEILKIFELGKKSLKSSWEERRLKGIDHSIAII